MCWDWIWKYKLRKETETVVHSSNHYIITHLEIQTPKGDGNSKQGDYFLKFLKNLEIQTPKGDGNITSSMPVMTIPIWKYKLRKETET